MSDSIKTRGNEIFCEKHKGWFYSHSFAKSGEFPVQCPHCKRYKYWIPKRVN